MTSGVPRWGPGAGRSTPASRVTDPMERSRAGQSSWPVSILPRASRYQAELACFGAACIELLLRIGKKLARQPCGTQPVVVVVL
jgi:hypothetical protein